MRERLLEHRRDVLTKLSLTVKLRKNTFAANEKFKIQSNRMKIKICIPKLNSQEAFRVNIVTSKVAYFGYHTFLSNHKRFSTGMSTMLSLRWIYLIGLSATMPTQMNH